MGNEAAIDWFPLWLSVKVAALATIVVAATGTAAAYALARGKFPGRDLIDSLVTLPLVLPPTVLGYYLLVVLSRNSFLGGLYENIFGQPLVFTWQAGVVAAIVHSGPLFVRAAKGAFEHVDRRYEQAARSLGASSWRSFFQVTLPLVSNQLFALAALAFARSMGDFGVTIMLAGNIPGRTQTVSVAIYDAVESGNGALARWLVLAVSATSIAILWPATRLSRRVLPSASA